MISEKPQHIHSLYNISFTKPSLLFVMPHLPLVCSKLADGKGYILGFREAKRIHIIRPGDVYSKEKFDKPATPAQAEVPVILNHARYKKYDILFPEQDRIVVTRIRNRKVEYVARTREAFGGREGLDAQVVDEGLYFVDTEGKLLRVVLGLLVKSKSDIHYSKHKVKKKPDPLNLEELKSLHQSAQQHPVEEPGQGQEEAQSQPQAEDPNQDEVQVVEDNVAELEAGEVIDEGIVGFAAGESLQVVTLKADGTVRELGGAKTKELKLPVSERGGAYVAIERHQNWKFVANRSGVYLLGGDLVPRHFLELNQRPIQLGLIPPLAPSISLQPTGGHSSSSQGVHGIILSDGWFQIITQAGYTIRLTGPAEEFKKVKGFKLVDNKEAIIWDTDGQIWVRSISV